MSKWFEILKEDWKERLKRIQEANKESAKGGKGQGGKIRPNKCDRCGRKMGKGSRYETRAGSTVCYNCRKRDKMGG